MQTREGKHDRETVPLEPSAHDSRHLAGRDAKTRDHEANNGKGKSPFI